MTLTTRVETTVRADVTVPFARLRLGLDWRGDQPLAWLELTPPDGTKTDDCRSGYCELGTGEAALVAVRELRAAVGELERHLAPAAAPPGAVAISTNATIPVSTSALLQPERASPVAPLAMPLEAIDALTNRWALARAVVGGAVIPVDTPVP